MFITDDCINCGTCKDVCPKGAIFEGGSKWTDKDGKEQEPLSYDHYFIVPEKCIKCRACFNVCPIQAIED